MKQNKPMTMRQWNNRNKRLRAAKASRRRKVERKPLQLYALELENGFWYVGLSIDAASRFRQHKSGSGATWTKLHKPIRIAEIRETGITSKSRVSVMEDDMTIEYAEKYGFNNVRGGRWCGPSPPKKGL